MIFDNPKPLVDSTAILNGIQREVHKVLKPLGFAKHGRTEHRFVSGDISQVIHFQLGQAYLGETHLLTVNIGIRVPECMEYRLETIPAGKKYYPEHECNLRSRLGSVEGRKESVYDLRNPAEPILADILRQITRTVLPAFEVLSSREAILAHRREYPTFDLHFGHLILREEAIMLNHMGQTGAASEKYGMYLHNRIHEPPRRGVKLGTRQGWLQASLKIAEKVRITLSPDILAEAEEFLQRT